MEKQTFITDTDGDFSHYYGEWHISGDIEDFLDLNGGKKLKITIEVLED